MRDYNTYRKNLRQTKREAGVCTSCLSRPARQGYLKCVKCTKLLKDHQSKNLDKCSGYNRSMHERNKMAAVAAYGGCCTCQGCSWHVGKCGITAIEVLTLDHVAGGGREAVIQKREYRPLSRWLKVNNYPPGFQVRCANCHIVKTITVDIERIRRY